MASTLPPVKNAAFTFHIALVSQADTDIFKTSPTLAAGDITVSKDGGNFANIGTLPTQIQTTGVLPVALTADEMNADIVTVKFVDAAGAEWQDALVTIYTCAQTLDTTDAAVDAVATTVGVAGVGLTNLGDARLANLDATISSRSTLAAGASMALTAAAVDAIWDELTAGHAIAGSTGKALSDAGAAGDPWAAAVRTLTSSAAATAATVAGSSITITRGDTASISITGLGSLALRTKLWFTVKNKHSDADTASVLQVEETGGLLYLNGAATTITNATLVVDDEAAGNITVTIKAAATAALSPSTYSYDVQQLTSDPAVHTETAGTFTVSADYTRAVA